ncbi:TIGR02611 family protein [Thermoactinospora rubra]|uniref:TIGR02611 family protein n=1 Tax=Thermoactinospora rubra TaxID=1088767 RepID=UPI000A10D0C7|nr:TIGR02611 family protein [Thermoactinospora rubra]
MAVKNSQTGDADRLKEEAARRSPIKGWLDGIRATRTGALTLKIVIGVIGAVMVVGGLIMVPFPGPGWLVVFAGLAVLATEFAWAHKVLEFGKRTLHAWTEWYKRQGWPVRIIVLLVTAATAAVIVYLGMKSVGVDLIDLGQNLLQR